MAKIGEKIKQRREQLGMTQLELAIKLGYKNKSTIAKIEAGVNDIVQSKVVEFANALDTTPAYLMGWEDVPSRPEREEVEIIKDPNAENEQWLIDIFRSLPDEDKSTLMSFALYLEQQAIYKNVSENADVLPTENIA